MFSCCIPSEMIGAWQSRPRGSNVGSSPTSGLTRARFSRLCAAFPSRCRSRTGRTASGCKPRSCCRREAARRTSPNRLRLARADWRDVLVAAGLADEDWRHKLDAELRPGMTRRARVWAFLKRRTGTVALLALLVQPLAWAVLALRRSPAPGRSAVGSAASHRLDVHHGDCDHPRRPRAKRLRGRIDRRDDAGTGAPCRAGHRVLRGRGRPRRGRVHCAAGDPVQTPSTAIADSARPRRRAGSVTARPSARCRHGNARPLTVGSTGRTRDRPGSADLDSGDVSVHTAAQWRALTRL